jgi:hypothetical protein
MMKAVIHFNRIGKNEAIYIEGLVRDDGVRLDTHTILPPEAVAVWTKTAWQERGILAGGEMVTQVRKHHFYQEWFDIIELLDASGALLGYYCDVLTPLRKVDGEYYLQDLLLDLWISPDGTCIELDWDEFEEAVRQNLVSEEYQAKSVETLRWMVEETRKGQFPFPFIQGKEI